MGPALASPPYILIAKVKSNQDSSALRILPPSVEQIVLLIFALGLTTQEFADLLEVPKSSVSYWRAGRMPDTDNSGKLWQLMEFPEVKSNMFLLPHIGRLSSAKEE